MIFKIETKEGWKRTRYNDCKECMPPILDWMILRLSGVEICKHIRAHEKSHDLSVLMLVDEGDEVEFVHPVCGA